MRVTTVERDLVEPAAEGPVLDGRYRLERRLGSGGMGSVWQARDLLLGRRVAVKLVSDIVVGSAAARVGNGAAGVGNGAVGGAGFNAADERLRREARAVGALAHPGVARLYDFCETAKHTYLVMELAEGESLAVQLTRGRMPPERAVGIAAQCAEALDAAHRAWVVHRDVKPSNIMLTPRGVKLVDFGIASTAGDGALTAVGRVLGTAAYLAPERATGRPATPATDLYALGVVLYQMLAGDLPFRAADAISMMHAHTVAEPFPLPADVPPALADICFRLLAKDPSARPRSGATVARMLRDAPLDVTREPERAPGPVKTAHTRQGQKQGRGLGHNQGRGPEEGHGRQHQQQRLDPPSDLPRYGLRRLRLLLRLRTRRAAALALGAAAIVVVFGLSGWLAHGNAAAPPPGQGQRSLPVTQTQSGK
jgi:serine/threonine-protein kinase